jgi:hypothetical protein
MISNKQTSDIVRGIVLANPFLVDLLKRGLLNVAQLARELLPLVRAENQKATVESIAVAISRLDLSRQNEVSRQLASIVHRVQLTVRTDVALLKFRRGAQLPEAGSFSGDDVFFMSQSPEMTTVIIDEKNLDRVSARAVERITGLGLLTIKDTQSSKPVNYRVTPGFIHVFLSNISQAGINIVDVFTGLDSVNFVLAEKQLMEAFSICGTVKARF